MRKVLITRMPVACGGRTAVVGEVVVVTDEQAELIVSNRLGEDQGAAPAEHKDVVVVSDTKVPAPVVAPVVAPADKVREPTKK